MWTSSARTCPMAAYACLFRLDATAWMPWHVFVWPTLDTVVLKSQRPCASLSKSACSKPWHNIRRNNMIAIHPQPTTSDSLTMPYLNVAFPVQGTHLPADHGYPLFAAITHRLPALH